jgi:hypothetical protein
LPRSGTSNEEPKGDRSHLSICAMGWQRQARGPAGAWGGGPTLRTTRKDLSDLYANKGSVLDPYQPGPERVRHRHEPEPACRLWPVSFSDTVQGEVLVFL